jgi:hypothetical protein
MSGRCDSLPEWAASTCNLLLKPFRIPQLLSAVTATLAAPLSRQAGS